MRNAPRVLLAMSLLAALLVVPSVALAGDDTPSYEENRRSFIGVSTDDGELPFAYEIAVDQIKLRNGDSHKVWVIAPGTTAVVSDGWETLCPWDDNDGVFIFTRKDLPFECTAEGEDGTVEFQVTKNRGARPSDAAVSNTAGAGVPTILLDGTAFAGAFDETVDGKRFVGTTSVIVDIVQFPVPEGGEVGDYLGYYIPESHKKVVDADVKVTCPFQYAGVEAVDGSGDPSITCSWKDGPGSDKARGTFELRPGAVIGQLEDDQFTVGNDAPGGVPSDVVFECGDGTNCEGSFIYTSSDDPTDPFVSLTKLQEIPGAVFLERFTLTYDPAVTGGGTPALRYDDVDPTGAAPNDLVPVCLATYKQVNAGAVTSPGGPGVGDDLLDIADDFDSATESVAVLPSPDTTCYLVQEVGAAGGGLVDVTYILYSKDGWRGFR